MDTNDSLRLASLWHSMHAISQQLSPTVGCSGLELLQADTFDLNCFQSLTGISLYHFLRSAGIFMIPNLPFYLEVARRVIFLDVGWGGGGGGEPVSLSVFY